MGVAAQIVEAHLGGTVQRQQSACRCLANGFTQIGITDTVVTCRGTEDVARGKHGIEHLKGQYIFAIELLLTPLAEGDDTGLPTAVSIIKDVFETQQVAGSVVELPERVWNEAEIAAHGIGNQAYVGLGSSTCVWTAETTASRRTGSMAAMELHKAVGSMSFAKNSLLCGVFTAYVHAVFIVALAAEVQLIPEGTDAILGAIGRIECGMGKVKTYIHDAHNNSLTRPSCITQASTMKGVNMRNNA